MSAKAGRSANSTSDADGVSVEARDPDGKTHNFRGNVSD